ncbi:hypothetical protein [Aeromonas caviae]|uniref:hypothetical protein n=1 Tax=Aeromonas caviae TaxID=648 RepID=UPI002E1D871F
MLLNEQVTAVIERTKDPVLSFDIARLIATPVFEKLKGFEIWTDCDGCIFRPIMNTNSDST